MNGKLHLLNSILSKLTLPLYLNNRMALYSKEAISIFEVPSIYSKTKLKKNCFVNFENYLNQKCICYV